MKCLITGGSGFLGSHLADELSERGHKVTIFDKRKSRWLKKNQRMVVGDLNNNSQVEKAIKGCNYVFHFAGLSDLNEALFKPKDSAINNIVGTIKLLKLCLKHKVKRFVYSSSIYVLSDQGGFYRVSKKAAEEYIDEFSKRLKLKFTILRFGTIYGPRSNNENGVRRIIYNSIKTGNVSYNGSSRSERRYIHVKDAAKITSEIFKKKYENKYINVYGSKKIKVKEFLKKIKKILKIKKKIKFKNKKILGHYVSNPSTYKFKKGIDITTASYKNFETDISEIVKEIKSS